MFGIKRPTRVIITLLHGDKLSVCGETVPAKDVTYVRLLPKGHRFVTGIGGDRLYGPKGVLLEEFKWRAGYSVHYEYSYD
ncbi:MAG: hypothetical protein PHD09_03910 [Candidatus Omnitrophica bacterium]|nr:hypothetical protein [Candidatus Omnitrophota bacterium]